MKIGKWFIGGIFVLSLIITTLITSIELATYADMSFYEKEYQKYQVKYAVQMEMEDIMTVTEEMMKFLKGNRNDLLIQVPINGEIDYFFNKTEIAHMEDVKELFIGGIFIRRISIGVLILSLISLILLKTNAKYVIVRSVEVGIGIFIAISLIVTGLVSMNFSKAFTIFHLLFFNNDLWLLDPDTDRLINILPEGFFVDTAIRIGIIFALAILLILVIAIIYERVIMDRKKLDKWRYL